MDVSRTAGKVLPPNKGSLHSHSCISKIVWHWTPLDTEAQPTCSTSSNIPTCRWTLHLLPAEFMKLFLPSHLHCSLGFSKRKEKLTSVCLTCREWCLPYIGQRRKMHLCVSVEKCILFPCSATKSAS